MIKKVFYLITILFLAACSTSVDGRDRRIGNIGEPTSIPTAVAAALLAHWIAAKLFMKQFSPAALPQW